MRGGSNRVMGIAGRMTQKIPARLRELNGNRRWQATDIIKPNDSHRCAASHSDYTPTHEAGAYPLPTVRPALIVSLLLRDRKA